MPTTGTSHAASRLRESIAPVLLAVVGCGAPAFAADGAEERQPPAGQPSTREVIRAEIERTGASIDANTLFGKLVDRYRGLSLYQDSVKLAHRTIDGATATSTSTQQSMGCTVDGSTLAVISSALGTGGSCDSRDASPMAQLELARQLWTLPHLALRFADQPLRSMRGGFGSLVPTTVDEVTIDRKQLLRLHLESDGEVVVAAGTECDESTVDLYVNPQSLLVERVEHSLTIAEGVRYEATLEITPERAVATPAATPAATPVLAEPTAPTATPAPAPVPSASPPAESPAAPHGPSSPVA